MNQFLHQLSLQSVDEDGRKYSKEFKTFWQHCLSVALQSVMLVSESDKLESYST